MTQIVDKRLVKMCNKCQSMFDKPCAWLSLGNEYCDEIMKVQQEIERLKEWKEDLLKENIELENIRKEAIEFIKNKLKHKDKTIYENDVNWLLNILQGDDK